MGSSRGLCCELVLAFFLLHLLNVCAGKIVEESGDQLKRQQQTQTAESDISHARELWGASNSDVLPMPKTRDVYSPPMSTVPIINPTTPTTFPAVNPATNPPTYMTPVAGVAAGGAVATGAGGGQSWCVVSPSASPTALQVALDYACGYGGADCSAIQSGGSCYNPNTVKDHASYAFNSYYQKNPVPTSCDFGGTAMVTTTDPSTPGCMYPSSSSSTSTTGGGGGVGGAGGGGVGVVGGGGGAGTTSPSFPSGGSATPVTPAGIYGSTGGSSSFGDSTASLASPRLTPWLALAGLLLLPLLLFGVAQH